MDWAYLAIGGFLLGSFFYTGFYTTRYEPEVKTGYAVVGTGILIAVAVNTWVDFTHNISDWFRGTTLASYIIITLGLVVITRGRREHKKK